jgi:hypothetical protein
MKGLVVSSDSGATFGNIISIGPYYYASIAASGNNLYITWETGYVDKEEVFFRASNDNGSTFGTTINLSNNQRDSTDPRIAAFNSDVYVVWQDSSLQQPSPYDGNYGNHDILFRASNDNGATFGDIIVPTNLMGHSVSPKITVSGDYIHVLCLSLVYEQNYDIFYTRSPPTANSPPPSPPSDPSPAPTPPTSDPSPTTLVSIDIKPNSDSNTVNCATQKGGVSVGIYTEDGFDAQDADVSTIELQGVEAKKYLLKDLDSDGDLDGVARFKKADLCESGEILSLSTSVDVKLNGLTDDGTQFEGSDIIRFRR